MRQFIQEMTRPIFLRTVTAALALCAVVALEPAANAQVPNGLIVSNAQAQAVLKHSADTKRAIPDNMLRVVDMGGYQLGVAVIGRGKQAPVDPNVAPRVAPNAPPPDAKCGAIQAGAVGPTGLTHLETDETYIVTSGSGTLILGGTLVNGRVSAADSEVTKVLNGPSCTGTTVGYTAREIGPGDVIVIPIGTPHGFLSIPDHITYLSLRPDPKKVLEHGYVNPALPKE